MSVNKWELILNFHEKVFGQQVSFIAADIRADFWNLFSNIQKILLLMTNNITSDPLLRKNRAASLGHHVSFSRSYTTWIRISSETGWIVNPNPDSGIPESLFFDPDPESGFFQNNPVFLNVYPPFKRSGIFQLSKVNVVCFLEEGPGYSG